MCSRVGIGLLLLGSVVGLYPVADFPEGQEQVRPVLFNQPYSRSSDGAELALARWQPDGPVRACQPDPAAWFQ
ncbi:MAG: hypothetical protein R3E89_10360 [Thiolinea sp.]